MKNFVAVLNHGLELCDIWFELDLHVAEKQGGGGGGELANVTNDGHSVWDLQVSKIKYIKY